jgi:hypothetical protein
VNSVGLGGDRVGVGVGVGVGLVDDDQQGLQEVEGPSLASASLDQLRLNSFLALAFSVVW